MIVVNLTTGTTTASTPIGFTQIMNTNSDFEVSGTDILIKNPGIYEIIGSATLVSSGEGEYTFGLYEGSTAVGQIASVSSAAEGDYETVLLYGVEQISITANGYVTLQFLATGTPSVYSGTVSIKRLV